MNSTTRHWIAALAFVAGSLSTAPAMAGGFTFQGSGALSMGRGGAFYSRGASPLAGFYAPALLSRAEGFDLSIGTNLAFYELCVTRYGSYGEGSGQGDANYVDIFGRFGDYAGEPFPEACSNSPIGVIPYLMGSLEVNERVGLSMGILPPLGASEDRWGYSVINTNGYERPQPLRYSYLSRKSQLIRAVLSAGYEVNDWLRLGAGLMWGITTIRTEIHQAPAPGEIPNADIYSRVEAVDPFIPGLILNANLRPHPNVDISLWFQWMGDSKASGSLTLVSGAYGTGGANSTARLDATEIYNAVITTPQPRELRVSFRYADKREGTQDAHSQSRGADPLRDERWDIELVLGYDRTSHIDAFRNNIGPNQSVGFQSFDAMGNPYQRSELPVRQETVIPKGFRDQFILMLGGDGVVIPNRFALRWGLSVESRGIDIALIQPDFVPGRRAGLHAGMTLRVGPVDLHASFVHFIQETLVSNRGVAAFAQPVSTPPGAIVNMGVYRMRMTALSVEAEAHF